MKILLIFPPRKDDTYIFPPTSLLYISQAVRAAGHEAQIIDIPYLLEKFPDRFSLLDNSLYEYIFNQEFDIIGLGGVVSTYFFYEDFVRRIRKLKKDIPIVVGGSVGVPIKDVWLKYSKVDYLVEGYGEILIQRLLNCLEKKDYSGIEKIPGLHYLKDGSYRSNPPERISDLDTIAFLSYDEIDYEFYITELTKWTERIIPDRSLIKTKKLRFLPLFTSRGCPYTCTFCFHFDKSYITYSINYVVEYIKFLKKKYNINALYIIDDLFILNRKRTIELCERISNANLNLYFFGSGGKTSLITSDMLQSMKKAGFIRFSYGIESGSQKILDIMQKKTTVEENLKAIKLTDKAGIPSFANLVFGLPGENYQTLKETKKMLIKANLNTKKFCGAWATAYPGSSLFDWMKEKNMITDTRKYLLEVGSIGNYLYNFTELSIDDLTRRVAEIHVEVDIIYFFKKGKLFKCIKLLILMLKIKIIHQWLTPEKASKLRNLIRRFKIIRRRKDQKPQDREKLMK